MSETDIQAILDGAATELDAGILLDDLEFRVLAYTAHPVIDESCRSAIVHRRASAEELEWFERCGIRGSSGPLKTPANPGLGILERWCVPVRFRGAHFGYAWVLAGRRIEEAELSPVIEAAEQIGVLLYRRRLATQADADLLRLLLIPNPENEHIAAEARATSFHMHTGPVAVIAIEQADGRNASTLNDLAVAVSRATEPLATTGVLGGVISGLGVVLAPLQDRSDLSSARRLAETVCRLATHYSDGVEFVGAIGGASELDRASHSYAEALRALRMVRAIPALGPVVPWDELGIFRALALLPPEEIESSVIDPRVRSLLADKVLSTTAETFLDLAGNLQATSARLYLHRATLYQRLDRISTLYGLDLRRSGDHRLLVHLGLKLDRLASR